MNIYGDDTIYLSEESSKALAASLLHESESLSLRDEFIHDIQSNMLFSDDGSIVVDIPEVEFIDREYYIPADTAVMTGEINIYMSAKKVFDDYYRNVDFTIYNQVGNYTDQYIYKINEKKQDFQNSTMIENLGKVS